MKRLKLMIALALVCSLALTACGTKKENSVYVYNWGEYIDPDIKDMFEEETGITVYYSEFEQNEDMYPIIEKGAVKYDVVCPSDYMIEKMIKNDLLAKINYDNVPNITNIDPIYLKTAENFDPKNLYSVPYCWGTVGLLYNKTMVEGPIDSWNVLFDSKYKNNILMIDSVRDAYMIALISLGYDQNTTDESQIEEATELLKNQYPLVQAYVIDQVREKMIGEEAAIGVIYSGEAIYTQRENENLEYVVPKEGSNVWIDGWVIPKNCQNKENAEAWINFMCREDIALKNFDYITYSTPNKAAKALIEDEEIRNSSIAFPSQDILDTCKSFNYLGEDIETLYLNKWLEVKK